MTLPQTLYLDRRVDLSANEMFVIGPREVRGPRENGSPGPVVALDGPA